MTSSSTHRAPGMQAARFFRKLLKGQGRAPRRLITDKLRSYSAAQRAVMPSVVHSTERYGNNRADVSHQPTRQREGQMRRFKSAAHAQRFLSVHGLVLNLFRVAAKASRVIPLKPNGPESTQNAAPAANRLHSENISVQVVLAPRIQFALVDSPIHLGEEVTMRWFFGGIGVCLLLATMMSDAQTGQSVPTLDNEASGSWFVELASPPTVDGTAIATLEREEAGFHAAART